MDQYIDNFDIDIKQDVNQININKKSTHIIHFKKNINIHLNTIQNDLRLKLFNIKLSGNINIIGNTDQKKSIHLYLYNCVILGTIDTYKHIVIEEAINCHFDSVIQIKKKNFFNTKVKKIRKKKKHTLSLTKNEPSSHESPGKPGQIYVDYKYMYVCIAKDTWFRLAFTLTDWNY